MSQTDRTDDPSLREVHVARAALDAVGQAPILFDALIAEGDRACVFVKTVRLDDPGVAQQRVTPRWPHHLPGELVIALTGQAAIIALRRRNAIDATWRGHGVRIRDARFAAPVLLGETFYTRVDILRLRRVRDRLYGQFRFRMWKPGAGGTEIETFRSEQDAMFFAG
jgi:hypothetical protein